MRRRAALGVFLFCSHTCALTCVFALTWVFASAPASAATSDLAFSRNARTFETQQSSLLVKGLAHACLTMTMLHDTLPCNPAMNALTKKPRMGATALLSNGYSTLDRMRRLLSGDLSQDQIDSLFGGDRVMQIEGNAELAFRAPYFSAKYTPFSPKYFSVVRNEANPDVDLYAVDEKNFVFQGGYEVLHGLMVGAQVRSVQREFIKQRFHLYDLATQSGRDLLKPKTQRSIYFEPGAAYFFGGDYNPRVSAMVSDLAVVQSGNGDISPTANLQAGIGISPPVRWGTMEVGLDYRSLTQDDEFGDRIHLGATYMFGAMSLVAGADAAGLSFGVYHGLDQVYAGITCSTTQVPWRNNDYFAQTVYLEVGWQI